jgi:hypothetical protein
MSDGIAAEIALRHNDPIVRAFVDDFLPLFFKRRLQLRADYRDADGNLVLPAMPEFLRVPPKLGTSEARPDLNFRRADHCRALCRVWSVIYSCTDWLKKEIREPNPAANRDHRYLSVERIAELAEVPDWQAERCLYWLRAARVITYTKQWREELPDGSHRSADAALRRVSLTLLERAPCTRKVLAYRRRKLGERADRRERRQARHGIAADIVRQQERAPAAPVGPLPPAPRSGAVTSTPLEIVDAVAAEHPSWAFADVLAEARRRAKPS